MLQVHTHMLF